MTRVPWLCRCQMSSSVDRSERLSLRAAPPQNPSGAIREPSSAGLASSSRKDNHSQATMVHIRSLHIWDIYSCSCQLSLPLMVESCIPQTRAPESIHLSPASKLALSASITERGSLANLSPIRRWTGESGRPLTSSFRPRHFFVSLFLFWLARHQPAINGIRSFSNIPEDSWLDDVHDENRTQEPVTLRTQSLFSALIFSFQPRYFFFRSRFGFGF